MANKDSRTLWVGDVEGWMDEEFLHRAFSSAGFVTNIKIVRRSVQAAGFAFIEFTDPKSVSSLVGDGEGKITYNALGFTFRINAALFGVGETARNREKYEHSVYVGGLDMAVRDVDLLKAFERYSSVSSAKVILDPTSQLSRGFGFVRFRAQEDADLAIREMQGVYLGSKAMKVRPSHSKTEVREESRPWTVTPPPSAVHVLPSATVLCISSLDAASPEDLQKLLHRCATFGAIMRHIFVESSCFVEYYEATAAEAAAGHLTGLCGLTVSFSDSSAIDYYRTLQLEGWLPCFEPSAVAISNSTTAKAERALQSCEPGSNEHFKALLQDPNFVRLFEQLLHQQGLMGKGTGVEDLWSMLLQDKPDLFNRPVHELVQASNADVAKAFMGTRMVQGLASLPDAMRLGL